MQIDTMNSAVMLSLVIAFSMFETVFSSYLMSKMCGELKCQMYEYCSDQELTCKPCKQICEVESHNYDEIRCERDCQDYVHDVKIGYARKSDVQALTDEVSKLYMLLVIILTLVVVLVTMVGGMLVKVLYQYRKRINLKRLEQKKFQEKLSSVQYTISNNNPRRDESLGTISQGMRNTMPSTITLTTQTESLPSTNKSIGTTKTLPLSVEEPCEDTTLDYAAYVNQALSHSPPNDTHLCPTKLEMT